MSDDRRIDVAHGIGPDGTDNDDGKTNTVGLGARGEMGDAAIAQSSNSQPGDGQPSGIRPGGPLGGGTGGGTAGAGGSGNDGVDTNMAHGADGTGIGAAGVGSPGNGHAGETDQVITGKPPAGDRRPVGGSSPFDD